MKSDMDPLVLSPSKHERRHERRSQEDPACVLP